MNKIIPTILLIFISFNSYSQSGTKPILKSFENYKNAILTDKGKIATDLVDSRTVKYYSNILKKIKTADSLEINSMGILDKITVLSMRHRATKNELLGFDGKKLLTYAFDNGMVGKNSVSNSELGEVIVNDDFAKAEFIVNGQKTPFFFHFYKENKKWRIDITHLFMLGRVGLKKMIEDSGKEENNFVIYILEMLTGKKPTNDIWKPLI